MVDFQIKENPNHFSEGSINNNHTSREIWIDIIRGITILLVVYSHLVGKDSILNSIFQTTRMPLFFFISGFFMYSVQYNIQLLWRRLKNRLIKQLYPTIIFFTLFISLFMENDFTLVFDEFKAGYWFTYTSVMFFITLAPLLWLFYHFGVSPSIQIIIFIIIAGVSVSLQIFCVSHDVFKHEISTLLSFEHYISYLRSLVYGCIFRILWDKYKNHLMKWYLFLFSIIGFIVSEIVGHGMSLITSIFGIYFMLFLVYSISNKSDASNKLSLWLSQLGKLTLEIYLLHYLIIYATLKNFLILDTIQKSFINSIFEFPIFISLSILIVLVCILVVFVFKRLKIYKFLFAKE